MTAARSAPAADLYCRVIDNFGDAGVAWRLARQLAVEHGWRVRLLIDRPELLDWMAPPAQRPPAVEVRSWADAAAAVPAAVVIEAFGCTLPATTLAAMAHDGRRHAWINLEYLTAEDWARGCHRLPSPHPALPLVKHFFLPGFTAGTGGVPCEVDLDARRAAFEQAGGWRGELAAVGAEPDVLTLLAFCYAQAPLAALADALAAGTRPVQLLLPPGIGGALPARRGALRCLRLQHRSQLDFDALLWSTDFNLVRGEDSFVRAQLAQRPFIWQPYPQSEGAHLAKLDAFAALYCDGLAAPAAAAWRQFEAAWNGAAGAVEMGTAWPALLAAAPQLQAHAAGWRRRLAQPGDLATNLAAFASALLE